MPCHDAVVAMPLSLRCAIDYDADFFRLISSCAHYDTLLRHADTPRHAAIFR